MEVHDTAKALRRAISNLMELGNTDKRFAKALRDVDDDEFKPEEGMGIWRKITNDWNPRDQEIVLLARTGMKKVTIAEKYKISRQQVHNVIKEHQKGALFKE